jgi:hypothetical protein
MITRMKVLVKSVRNVTDVESTVDKLVTHLTETHGVASVWSLITTWMTLHEITTQTDELKIVDI